MSQPTPDALLFITTGCQHCPIVLQTLVDMVKHGTIGRLEVINSAIHPELAEEEGIRSAPWTQLGPFILEGAQTPAALQQWAAIAYTTAGDSRYIKELLNNGQLVNATKYVGTNPSQRLASLLPLLGDIDATMQLKLGVDAILEEYSGSDNLQRLIPELAHLSRHSDRRIRIDACHYLGLTADPAARPYLTCALKDSDSEVQEVAQESLHTLLATL